MPMPTTDLERLRARVHSGFVTTGKEKPSQKLA